MDKTKEIISSLWTILSREIQSENQRLGANEIIELAKASNVFDNQENWMLINTPALYLLEKATSMTQMSIRKSPPEETLKKIYAKEQSNIPCLKDSMNPPFRYFSFKEDFQYDGNVTNHAIIRTGDRYDTKIRKLAKTIALNLNQNIKNFILILSLSFGGNEGGHFGAVIGTPTEIFVFDPYFDYYKCFEIILQDSLHVAQTIQIGVPLSVNPYITTLSRRNISSFLPFRVEEAVHPQDVVPALVTPKIAKDIQDVRGQDHFCWGWCILYFHTFMISGCNIKEVKNIFTNLFNDIQKNIYYIKAYIYYLFKNKLFSPVPYSEKYFFENVFNHVWTEISGLIRFEIDHKVDLLRFLKTIRLFQVPSSNILVLKMQDGTEIKLTNEPATKTLLIGKNPNLTVNDNIIYLAYKHYFPTTNTISNDPDSSIYVANDHTDLSSAYCDKIIETYNLKRFAKKGSKTTCAKLIEQRNIDMKSVVTKGGRNPTCVRSLTSFYPYQERVFTVLRDKLQRSTGRAEGLLIWYGTGTGKTLSAVISAKFLAYCNPVQFTMCYIISPKSAFSNFQKELALENIFCDEINPGNTDAHLYYRAGNIKIFSHTNFRTYVEKYNPNFQNALFIIDEAHNYSNVEGSGTSSEAQFILGVCQRMKQVVLLTATPMLNSPYDIEFLMAMIDGRELVSRDTFYERYIPNYKRQKERYNFDFTDMCDGRTPSSVYTLQVNNVNMQDFSNKIIRYETSGGGSMPDYKDAVSCITGIPNVTLIIEHPNDLPRTFNSRSTSTSFGRSQNTEIWNLDYKQKDLFNLIERREKRDVNELTTSPNETLNFDPKNIKYKYIIYSELTENLEKVKNFLIEKGIDNNIISQISGDIKNRKEIARKFNEGYQRIMLISPAAEEGVDFKRVSIVFLLEPPLNWSTYVQVRGRAVRIDAHQPPSNNIPDADGKVAKTVESIISVVNIEGIRGGVTVPCWELNSFRIMYLKKKILEDFENELRTYFIPNPVPPNPTKQIISI